MLVEHTREFHRRSLDCFAIAAPGDLVARTGRFGASPTSAGSGFTRLRSQGEGHSSYLRPGRGAQDPITAVVLGRSTRRWEVPPQR